MYEELIEKKDSASTTKFKKEFIIKNNKAVRKRLSFVNINEKDISEKDIKNDMNSDNLSLTEKVINDIDQVNDLTNISIIIHPEHSKLYTKNNEKMNYEFNFPSTSRNNVNLNVDNISNKISLINKNTNEDEDDICNMTYTQYLNKKLEGELDILNIISRDNTSDIKTRIIIITTKFNPPSREKIINSMKMYNILELKNDALFFSNKIDLIKCREKESLNNSSIYNVIPFKCSLDKVTGIKLWRRVKINEFYPSGSSIKSCDIKRILAGYNSLVIHPLIHPPTSKNVKTWLKAKKYLSKKNKHKEISNNIDILKDTKENNIKETFKESMKYHSQCSNNLENSNNSFNPSLQEMLENPLLYMNDTRYLGISYGQIEYNLKEYSNNAEKENRQTAKSLNMVIIILEF